MTTRRLCWIAGLLVGILGAGLVVGVLNSRKEQQDVQLLFLGYRNETVLLRNALLVVTNSGRVPVQFLPIWEAHGRFKMFAHLRSYLRVNPQVLKPGESAQAELLLAPGRVAEIHRAELAYYRLDLAHRARSSTNAAMRTVARLFSRQPKVRWARSQAFTNSVTVTSVRRYDMLFALRNK